MLRFLLPIVLTFSFLQGEVEIMDVDVISYEDFASGNPQAIQKLKKALWGKGIAGVKSVPGFKEKSQTFLEMAQTFAALPLDVKQKYSPNRPAGEIMGFEIGMEKFQRPDGTWVIDDSKASYYASLPNNGKNVWPQECDLQTAYEDVATLMFNTGIDVMRSIGFVGANGIMSDEGIFGICRMLHYVKQSDETMANPFWCGAHFDHGLFTALMPAYYFQNGSQVSEPSDAGLFVRIGDTFYKVISDESDIMLFQVGEFGQLATNDAIKATQHRVHKAVGGIERYTMAVFFDPPLNTVIHSTSELTSDARYGAGPGQPCTYQDWEDASYARYLAK